jgi:integrase
MIDEARSGDKVASRAAFFRQALAGATSPQDQEIILSRLEDEADALTPWDRSDPDEGPNLHPDAVRLYGLATGTLTEMEPLVEPWLADRSVKDKTKIMDRQAVRLLLERHKTVQALTKRAASQFVSDVLAPGRDAATINRMLTSIRSFWSWLEVHGYRPEAPSIWAGLNRRVDRADEQGDEGDDRRPFTEEEAAAFLRIVSRVSTNLPLDSDMLSLLATSTLRLSEACSLRCQDIAIEGEVAWVSVRGGKTKAAKRRFPVVEPSVAHMLKYRKEASSDGYIFSELSTVTDTAGRTAKRSSAISQRLGRYLDKHLNTDGRLVAGHGWRHRARTLLEHGGVSPWIADALMGHERPGEGLSRYSQGPSDKQLLEAANKIHLPHQ